MKLLMENWRKFNEATEPVLGRTEIEDIITDKFSFNSLQGPDHRFTPGPSRVLMICCPRNVSFYP